MKRYIQSIVKLIQQQILYYTKLNEFKKAKDTKLLNLFQVFVSKFSSRRNAQNRIISNFIQIIIDWKNNIIEKNNNKDERKYRLNENNRELKEHEEIDDYENNE